LLKRDRSLLGAYASANPVSDGAIICSQDAAKSARLQRVKRVPFSHELRPTAFKPQPGFQSGGADLGCASSVPEVVSANLST
jgi:hypothetical protein